MLAQAKGLNGSLELHPKMLVIRRSGFNALVSQGVKGDKEIAISQISAVQFKVPGTFTNGYIQFSFIGGQESKSGIFDAVKDENSVVFTKKQLSEFENLKSELNELRYQ
ncbi:DUF4429 domain-containing protein [Dehalogenimonas alkenigignens]|uniref:DUF4429 domain-containing protein n=1 Tax=Dehalogenimonas alkenigignens TaxID=1217799 RepID=A0A0W0GGM9_9CHLR|nr:DUF4429 domain-containing protein [Dehalogenimonas alkenigignens]KTB47702.1 protein of unknown function (DUF4429) [Dehalogenimonas alkenigignens]PVV84031.1 DUF4429 domain-containing protein [Dehalogenimonas alkenigignens]